MRVPLLNYKVVADAQKLCNFDFTPRQLEAAQSYAKTAGSARFAKLKETEARNLFCQKILGEVLGYTQFDADPPYTLAFERSIRRGTVDVALGHFGFADGADEIVAPFELKGPTTPDLDAIMPGRGYSPVQQAWTALVAAGTFAPLAALFYGFSQATADQRSLVVSAAICLAGGLALHLGGRAMLWRLRE